MVGGSTALASVCIVGIATIDETEVVGQIEGATAFNADTLLILGTTEILSSAMIVPSEVIARSTFVTNLSYVINAVLKRFKTFTTVQVETFSTDDTPSTSAFQTVGDFTFTID